MKVLKAIGRGLKKAVKGIGKFALPVAGAVGGMLAGGPIGAAAGAGAFAGAVGGGLVGAGVGLQGQGMINQAKAAKKMQGIEKKALGMQAKAIEETKAEQAQQRQVIEAEQQRLAKEESDRIRAGKKRGRRGLLAGDETGVNGTQRKTLG